MLCYIINKASKITFCKNTIRLVLCIGREKFTTIAMNYSTTKPKSHSTSSEHNNDVNIITLKDEIKSFIKLLADEQGKSYTIRFLREHNKVCICDTELDTIELPSYYAKNHLH